MDVHTLIARGLRPIQKRTCTAQLRLEALSTVDLVYHTSS